MAPGLVGGVCVTSPQLLGQRHVRWTQELWQALQPYGTGGVYVNNIGREEEDETGG
jgi:hypothetical protein